MAMLALASPASASLSCALAGGEAVGEVAAGEMRAARLTLRRRRGSDRGSAARVSRERWAMRSVTSPIRDMQFAHLGASFSAQAKSSCQARPSRAISAVASDGPQLPAG